ESRTKDFRQLGDKPIVYDINDKPLVFVRQSQLFLDDCQAYKFTPDNKLGSRVLPGGNGVDALARMHEPAQMKKTRRAVKRPATPTCLSDDLPSPHFYPMESTKVYEDIEKELRGNTVGVALGNLHHLRCKPVHLQQMLSVLNILLLALQVARHDLTTWKM
ncbi:hypothetical protein K525DRAFT_246669, partial [Schizophyllum commune Loenen D]